MHTIFRKSFMISGLFFAMSSAHATPLSVDASAQAPSYGPQRITPYVGLNLGYESMNQEMSFIQAAADLNITSSVKNDGALGTLKMGVHIPLCAFFLEEELSISHATFSTKQSFKLESTLVADTTLSKNWSIALAQKFGFYISPHWRMFGLMEATNVNFKLKTRRLYNGTFHSKTQRKNLWGAALGVGLQFAFNEKIDFEVGYKHSLFGRYENDLADQNFERYTTFRISPKFHGLWVGMHYKI